MVDCRGVGVGGGGGGCLFGGGGGGGGVQEYECDVCPYLSVVLFSVIVLKKSASFFCIRAILNHALPLPILVLYTHTERMDI